VKKISILSAAAALSLAFAGGSFAQAPAGSPVAEHGTLKVSGGQILDQNNEPVQLRGVSLYWTLEENARRYYNASVVKALKDDWKGNVIRAAMGVGGCKGSWKSGYSSEGDAHDKAVADVVAAAVANGIYVIVDWHSHEAHNQTAAAKAYFERVAAKYKDVPNVIFEIYNEPIDIGGCDVAYANAKPIDTWAQNIKPYSETIVKAIRDKGANNLIILGTPFYCQFPATAASNPVVAGGGANLLYSFHFYAAEHTFFGRVDEAANLGKAVFVSEFGTTMASGDGTVSTSQTDTWFETLDVYQVGWANWSFSNMGQSSSALSSDRSGGNLSSTTASGTYIKNALIKYATSTWAINVTIDGNGTVEQYPKPKSGKHRHGLPVKLTAVPEAGWEFVSWSGAVSGKNNPVTLPPLYADKSIKAVFAEAGNLIKNGKFTDLVGWAKSPSTGDIAPNMAVDAQGLKVSIAKATAGDSKSAYITQGDISLTQGHKYRLSFKAKADGGSRKLVAAVTSSNTITPYLTPPLEASLTAAMVEYKTEFDFTRASVTNARVLFQCGDQTGTWYLNDVKLEDLGQTTGVQKVLSSYKKTPWSLVQTSAGVQLRGPIEAGAGIAFYDTRGKLVGRMAAAAGRIISLGAAKVPAGNYLVVVKDMSGTEVHRARVSLLK